MTGKEAYRIWAPEGGKWSGWVRPVPFWRRRQLPEPIWIFILPCQRQNMLMKHGRARRSLSIPRDRSVRKGSRWRRADTRPVPIYNGTVEQQGARAAADNQSVGKALVMSAAELAQTEISGDALPAFLTDSGRRNRFRMEHSLFDNSWDIYPQICLRRNIFRRTKSGKSS